MLPLLDFIEIPEIRDKIEASDILDKTIPTPKTKLLTKGLPKKNVKQIRFKIDINIKIRELKITFERIILFFNILYLNGKLFSIFFRG